MSSNTEIDGDLEITEDSRLVFYFRPGTPQVYKTQVSIGHKGTTEADIPRMLAVYLWGKPNFARLIDVFQIDAPNHCEECGRRWFEDAPAGRCPFEVDHRTEPEYVIELRQRRQRISDGAFAFGQVSGLDPADRETTIRTLNAALDAISAQIAEQLV